MTSPTRTIIACDGCGREIDPDTCHCGMAIGGGGHDGHMPVPMGCDCFRGPSQENPVGFTGTAVGMTAAQQVTVGRLLENVRVFHHGDCVGSDAEAHQMTHPKCEVVIHPPMNDTHRAWCHNKHHEGQLVRSFPPREYLVRNHDIVDSTELLIATPKLHIEEQRSGTWATIRYARKCGKPVIIVWPDGSIKREEPLTIVDFTV